MCCALQPAARPPQMQSLHTNTVHVRQTAPDKSKGSFACSAQLLTGCRFCHRETSSLKLAKLRGCTFVNQYVVIKYLGRGACGRVFLCMDMTDNRLYAVKVCSTFSHM